MEASKKNGKHIMENPSKMDENWGCRYFRKRDVARPRQAFREQWNGRATVLVLLEWLQMIGEWEGLFLGLPQIYRYIYIWIYMIHFRYVSALICQLLYDTPPAIVGESYSKWELPSCMIITY